MAHLVEDTRAPLVASRKESSNAKSHMVQEHRKRKSSTFHETAAPSLPFDAVSLPATQYPQSFTFIPLTTVLRAHVPLTWLSSSVSHRLRPGTILKATITTVLRWEYHILVARIESGDSLFAFERIEVDVYVCYPLNSWVKPQWVESAAFGAAPLVDLMVVLKTQGESSHSRKPSSTSVTTTTEPPAIASPKVPQNRRGQLARLSILESKERTEDPSSTFNNDGCIVHHDQECINLVEEPTEATPVPHSETTNAVISVSYPTSQVDEISKHKADAPETDQTHEVIATIDHLSQEHLRRQYLETLYLSKTSLAFYTKGPLSRARARSRMCNASQNPADLSNFYKECILPTKKMDLKYKESLKNRLMSLGACAEAVDQTPGKTRKSRRTKLGKDALWPVEHEYIERWWKAQEFPSNMSRTVGAYAVEMQRAISRLRTRETEMQIILILEVLALEERDVFHQTTEVSMTISEVKVESVEQLELAILAKAPTAKKARNLESELDFLVDRLCIWHSIGFEEPSDNTDDSQKLGSSSQKIKDQLRDFCKDVIVPFYGGKLPTQCHALCTKMGGPEISPLKVRGGRAKEPLRQLPGSAIAHERPSSKRNLQNVLTEDQNVHHASPPTLTRSSTMPMPSHAKREASDRPLSRHGMQKSVSFSNREVDLVADARATAAKRRKLDLVAAQKRELDAAIAALKKPNRSMVAKNFMDDVERRATESKAVTKKVEPVQISATPRRGTARFLQTDDYELPPMPLGISTKEASVVPSSTAKPRGLGHTSNYSRSSDKKRAVLSAIHDTPGRGSSRPPHSNMADHNNDRDRDKIVHTASRSTMVASTPGNPRLLDELSHDISTSPLRMSKSLRAVLFTPVRRSEANIEQAFRDAPEIPEQAGRTMDRAMGSKTDAVDLYDSLGWNDDYDL